MCDPDCLCVIFSFIRDEQPRVGLAGGGWAEECVWMQGVGSGYGRGGFTGNGK